MTRYYCEARTLRQHEAGSWGTSKNEGCRRIGSDLIAEDGNTHWVCYQHADPAVR